MNIRRLGSISMGHMALDIMANSVAIILTAVSDQFDLSVGQIGLGALVIMCTSSLTQPFFGALADRLRGRWLGPVGLLWYMLCFCLVPFAPTYPILIGIFMLAGFGSAALHTAGMVISPDAGGNQPTTATSIFFLFGQTGLALGPVISGYIIQYMGLPGLPLVALAMTPVMVTMFAFLRDPVAYDETTEIPETPTSTEQHRQAQPTHAAQSTHATQSTRATHTGGSAMQTGVVAQAVRNPAVRNPAIAIGIFLLLIILRSTTFHAYMTFLPKFLENQGYQSAAYGTMTGIFTFGGAMGTFIGGWLGDRYSRRMVIAISLVLAVPFCYLLLGSSGLLFTVSAIFAGALLNMSHSIMIILGQAILPKSKGMMSGVTLGFTFASGAFVAWIAGIVADVVGLTPVMYILAGVPVVAGLVALLLPRTKEANISQPVPATAPAPAGD